MLNEGMPGRTNKRTAEAAKAVRPRLDKDTLARLPGMLSAPRGTATTDVPIELFDTCTFEPGLALVPYGSHRPPPQYQVPSIGVFNTAADARRAAAEHFSCAEQDIHLRLDLRGDPIFSATLPDAYDATHTPSGAGGPGGGRFGTGR